MQQELTNEASTEEIQNVNALTQTYKRFSVKQIVSLGLTVVAVMVVLTQLNFNAVTEALQTSNHLWALASFVIGLGTFLGGALVLYGFGSQLKPKFLDVLLVQVSAAWQALQVPNGVGPLFQNARYLNKHAHGNRKKLAQNTAIATVVQITLWLGTFVMMLILAVLTSQNQLIKVNANSNIVYLVIAVVAVIAILLLIPASRQFIINKIKPLAQQFLSSFVLCMRSRSGVLLGLLGVVVQALAYSGAFWAALQAFGQNLNFLDITLVFLIGNAAGSAVPTPGGLGAVEAALTVGFTALGVPPTIALSSTLLFRVCTFWARAPIGMLVGKVLAKRGII
jgi:uncharacterized membrane protein YbhN (UPF0104 family)